jgi:hypothetical protein
MATAVIPDVVHKVPQADNHDDGTLPSLRPVLTFPENVLSKPKMDALTDSSFLTFALTI